MSYGQPPSGYGYGPQQYPPQGHPPGYGPHGQPIGPRDHPSAIIALGLGLAAVFLLGALLGVPAILVGRSGIKAIRLEPHRWQGGTTATLGIVLGWISVAETAVIAGVMLTITLDESPAAWARYRAPVGPTIALPTPMSRL